MKMNFNFLLLLSNNMFFFISSSKKINENNYLNLITIQIKKIEEIRLNKSFINILLLLI
jgi:hypothetical protein